VKRVLKHVVLTLAAVLAALVASAVDQVHREGATFAALREAGYKESILRPLWTPFLPWDQTLYAFLAENGGPDGLGGEGYVYVGVFGDTSIYDAKLTADEKPDEP
jgi:hypothetical protein